MVSRLHDPEYYKKAMVLFRTKRQELGQTQQEIANELKCSLKTYNQFERQKTIVNDGQFEQLLKKLKIDRTEMEKHLSEKNISTPSRSNPKDAQDNGSGDDRQPDGPRRTYGRRSRPIVFSVIGLIIIMAIIGIWFLTHQKSDEQQIEAVVKAALPFESLTLYEHPEEYRADIYRESQIDRYWVPGSRAASDVDRSLKYLIHSGLYYGNDARLENLSIRLISVSEDRHSAEATIEESWHLPVYNAAGLPVTAYSHDIPPTVNNYVLHKMKGQWLIYSSTSQYTH